MLLFLCFTLALQDEIKDGVTYVNAEHGLKVSIPSKEWGRFNTGTAMEYGWQGGLVELCDNGGAVCGAMALEMLDREMSAEQYADAMYQVFGKNEEIKNFKNLKSEKAGAFVRREFTFEFRDTHTHWIMMFGSKGKKVYRLGVWTLESDWDKKKDEVMKIADSFKAGEGDKATAPEEKPAGGGEKIANPWEPWAEGSWAEFSMNTTANGVQTEMSQKQTLVKKEAEELTLKVEGKMVKPAAMDMPASEMKVPLRGGGGGPAGNANAKEIGKGEEELEVAGKKVKCAWVEMEMEMNGGKGTVKVWKSDQVPGGTVKTVTKGPDMDSTMMLTGYEGKK
jgi:hypothetical protein